MTKTMDLLMWELYLGQPEAGRPLPRLHPRGGRRSRVRARRDRSPDAKERPGGRDRPVHGGLQRGVGTELGLRPDHRGGGALPGQEPEADPGRELGDDRRARGRGGRRGADPAGHQPGAGEDERPPAAVRLVALPHRPAQGRRVRVFALGVKPEYQHFGVAAALYVRHVETAARVRQKGGEMGWILEDERADEPGHGGDGGDGRQALPALRAPARVADRFAKCGKGWRESSPAPPKTAGAPLHWPGSGAARKGSSFGGARGRDRGRKSCWRRRRSRSRSLATLRSSPAEPAAGALAAHGRGGLARRDADRGDRRRRRAGGRRGHRRRGSRGPLGGPAQAAARSPHTRGGARSSRNIVASRSFLVDVHILGNGR